MTGWGRRPPPACDEQLGSWVLTEPPELRVLRAAVQHAVLSSAAASVDPRELAERLVAVATELAGNVLRHARPPAVVVLHRCGADLMIDVSDDTQSHPALDERRPVGEGGLGLVLAQRLAQDAGWYPSETGKRVWALFSMTGR